MAQIKICLRVIMLGVQLLKNCTIEANKLGGMLWLSDRWMERAAYGGTESQEPKI